MYIKMLLEIEKFKEADKAFATSDIQFNIGDVHIIHKHALRGCMNQRGFKYLHLRKKSALSRRFSKTKLIWETM